MKLKALGEFKSLCNENDVDAYMEKDPHAVLMHCQVLDPLLIVNGEPGETTDRLAMKREASISIPEEFDPAVDYSVFVLQSRDGSKADEFLIGCGDGCDVVIRDASVSRAHAWIEKRGEKYFIRDNASAAGTMLNDSALDVGEEKEVRSGAKITMGRVDLLFLGPREFYHFVRRLLCN
ncbi:MAG: FHA domain-containing protein [Deltaproteobacteria bacterium]|nr:FHA domain-containing protein [Deltaproteobacteria bacterium]